MIIISKYDHAGKIPLHNKCSACDEHLNYPFLYWTYPEMFLCASCCKGIKRGLIADLIHITAIQELQAAGYFDHTLDRRTHKIVDDERLKRNKDQMTNTMDNARKSNRGESTD